jgi:hypothetical protein
LRRCLDELAAEDAARAGQDRARQQSAAQYLDRVRGESVVGRPPAGVDPVALAEARIVRLTASHGPDHPATRKATARYETAKAKAAAEAEPEAAADVVAYQPPAATPAATTPGRPGKGEPAGPQRNSTDPDSRVMPTRKGFIQGYNAQLAASEDHFIIASDLVQDTGDMAQLEPMLGKTTDAAETLRPHRPDPAAAHATIGTALADNGYCSDANLTAPGPDRLIATGKRRDLDHAAAANPATGPPPGHATATEAMHHRLRTPDGAAQYRRRGATIEPINGHLKDRTGLRTFLLRGLEACNAELHLAALAHNLRRLHTLQHT